MRVKKLIRDMQGVVASISGEGPSPFQDPEIVAQRKKSFDQHTAAIKRYPQKNDPDVMAMRAAYQQLGATLKQEFERSREQLKIVGNAFERLATIDNRDKEYPVPAALQPPFTQTDAQAWLAAGSKARTAAEFDMQQFKEIKTYAYLPEQTVSGRMAQYSFRDIDRLSRNVQSRFNSVQAGYGTTHANIKRRLAELDNQVQAPSAGHDLDTIQRHRQALDDMVPVARSVVHLESVLKRPTNDANTHVEALQQRRTSYDRELDALIDRVRMPEPKSPDATMLAIAEEVLKNPRYEFGAHGPIVLTSTGMTEREKQSSEIDFDKAEVSGNTLKLSGTETTWTYRWREFHFMTALREPGTDLWRLHQITPKYFTSGGTNTPLNSWISGGVVATDLIRENAVFAE